MKLSIIVPGVRHKNWVTMYQEIIAACKGISFEVIFVGPGALPTDLLNVANIKFLMNYGSPSRCLQMGSMLAEGEYLTWLSDDATVVENSISEALTLLESKDSERDIIAMRYTEGVNKSANTSDFNDAYWQAWTHNDLRLEGVEKDWKIPCVMMLKTNLFKTLGGLDCQFEHINFNVHDLAFRAQRSGSTVHLSPNFIMRCDWEPNRNVQNSPVIAAYPSDKARFLSMYSLKDTVTKSPIAINYMNWLDCEVVWSRRFK